MKLNNLLPAVVFVFSKRDVKNTQTPCVVLISIMLVKSLKSICLLTGQWED